MPRNCSSLVCPITFSLFHDPVSAEDGHTYERAAIVQWIERNSTSPLTREPISVAGLRPNHLVRSLVAEFQTNLSKRNYKFKLGVDIDRSSKPFFHTTGKSVYEAKWIGNPNGPPIALLKLYGARAEKEASYYEQLTRHPHIVYTYGLVDHPAERSRTNCNTSVMLLQEMALEGNLLDVLEHRLETHPNQPFSNVLLNEMFMQITSAMIFLVDKGIVHGDLACRNILVFRIDEEDPKQTLVKLTDFGISRGNTLYSKIDAVATMIDTIPIRTSPPEVIDPDTRTSGDVYSQKSDMYSMGVLMWEIYSSGQLPWHDISDTSVIKDKVMAGERVSRPENCVSDQRWSLISKCMSQDPNDRPTFENLKTQLAESESITIDLPESTSIIISPPEPVLTVTNSSEQNLSQTTSLPLRPITTEPQKKKQTERPQSLIEVDETEQQLNCTYVPGNVKDRREFFEKRIKQEERSSSEPRLSSRRHPSSPTVKPPLPIRSIVTVVEKTVPQEQLIKLVKWH